ncbi:MAG: hypothetical protein ACOKSU_13545 [Pseudomonas sp.]|uniref:hypothetical protein n=1 Tax=Pseudomonas TaxID=286 RepID=UPI0003C07FCF|nr:hypothetical protein [Pseudomonas sp. VLB120]AGZ37566.1 hypothetical protein PVLB_23935 [Pseudomonas sp. VLB120]
MRVLIIPMRHRGIELTKQERRDFRAIAGDVYVQCVEDESLGRATNRAYLQPLTAMYSAPLPPLFDVKLSGMATLGFVLSGYEVIEGCAYAQSWWCRLE